MFPIAKCDVGMEKSYSHTPFSRTDARSIACINIKIQVV
jgi:hypothetical protein